VPAFSSKEQAASVFTTLFEILLEDDRFESTVRKEGLTVLFKHSDPDMTVYLDADGVYVDEVPNAPAITIQMSCTTADALWAGRLLMPIALATRKIKISGSVAKVIEFVPMLQPAFDRYPQIAADAGVNA
jgi:putative sterol carrier protein